MIQHSSEVSRILKQLLNHFKKVIGEDIQNISLNISEKDSVYHFNLYISTFDGYKFQMVHTDTFDNSILIGDDFYYRIFFEKEDDELVLIPIADFIFNYGYKYMKGGLVSNTYA